MSEDKYQVHVVEQPAYQVVGLKVRTSMATAMVDCPQLWEKDFGPRMPEVATFPGLSFGVSLLVDAQNGSFDYWAALPYRPDDPIPAGMALLDLPAGLYAVCHLKSLEDLAGAYQHIYMVWGPDAGYDFRDDAPSYETYPADHLETGRLSVYMPLKAKEKT